MEDLREQVRRLQGNLELANADAEAFRKQWQDLRLRNQALGIDALTDDRKRLENRVVEAVKELYQTEQERRGAMERLRQLLASGEALLKGVVIDPHRQADLETYEVAVHAARSFLEASEKPDIPIAADQTQGQIVHMNGELRAVILNLGTDAYPDMKPGMPFRVMRDDKVVGRIKVLEVREAVSAALIESVENGKELKIGDHVAVAAEK